MAVVQAVVGIRRGWDAALLQQLQESQWWHSHGCCGSGGVGGGGGGSGGPASQVKVLLVGWRWSAHVLTVPTSWQAEIVKAADREKKIITIMIKTTGNITVHVYRNKQDHRQVIKKRHCFQWWLLVLSCHCCKMNTIISVAGCQDANLEGSKRY